MKLKSLFLLPILGLGLLLSSCAIHTPIASMEQYYEKKMSSSDELFAKSNIKIFYNEIDVPCEYTVLALIKYEPLLFPPFMTEKGKMTRKFLKKTVLKANELQADAIIIQGMGFAKAIIAPELRGNSSDDNILLTLRRSYLLEQFTDGSIANLSKKETAKLAKSFANEIEDNIKDCKTLEDVAYVTQKIDALEKYLVAEGKNTHSLKEFREDLSKIETKIIKKEKRAKKIAEGKAKIAEGKAKVQEKIATLEQKVEKKK